MSDRDAAPVTEHVGVNVEALQAGFTGSTTIDSFPFLVPQPNGTVVASSWFATALYDPVTNAWTPRAPPPYAAGYDCVARLPNGNVLRAGGTLNRNTTIIYSPSTNTWTNAGNFTIGRASPSCVELADGRVLMAGGMPYGSGSTNDVDVFNPVTNTWTQLPKSNMAHYLDRPVLLDDGRVLFVDNVELYSPSTGQWTTVSETARHDYGVKLVDGRVLLVSTFYGAAAANIFDPATNSLTPTAAPSTRTNAAATLAFERPVISGGSVGNTTGASVEYFDPQTESWSAGTSLLQAREGHAMVSLSQGFVLAVGGRTLIPNGAQNIDPSRLGEVLDSACVPRTCASAGFTCGTASDGCGGTLSCGSCGAGLNCSGNQCTSCVPTTCAALGYACGTASDGCGGTLSCGTCTAPTATCGAHVCAGAVLASYDTTLRAPRCTSRGASCDPGVLLNGRGPLGPEPNAPNTLRNSCQDGTFGAYRADESLDRLMIFSPANTLLTEGQTATIKATVWGREWSGNDRLDLFISTNPTALTPTWTFLVTIPSPSPGAHVLSANITLPVGSTQAIRGVFRYGGTATPCNPSFYNDHDDLVFEVAPGPDVTPPSVSIVAPAPGVVRGLVNVSVTATDPSGISGVSIFDGATLLGTLTTAPYALVWDTGSAAQGTHELRATATDGAGNPASTSIFVSVDNTPLAELVSPTSGAVLSGVVTLDATASAVPGRTITSVEFLVDGAVVGTDDQAPFSFSWNSRTVANAAHVLAARATDSAGASGQTAGTTVSTANDFVPPSVAISSPLDGALVRGTITIDGTAGDEAALQSIEVSVDGAVVHTTASSPFTTSWNTTLATDGQHTLEARATDGSANQNTAAVVVTVDNTGPSVAITAPAAGPMAEGAIAIAATATDANGVTSVGFRVDGQLIGTASSAPFSAVWQSTGLGGAHVLTAVATDAAGNTTTSAPVTVTIATSQLAAYSSVHKAPACAALATSCSTGTLVNGRHLLGPEPNQPNTIGSTCADGAAGSYHNNAESNDGVLVRSQNGGPLVPGALARVEATIWATDTTDRVDVWYAANAASPSWVLAATLTPTIRDAASVVSTTYTVPAGATQAVRVSLRRGGSAVACPSGNRNDRDDLVFVTQ